MASLAAVSRSQTTGTSLTILIRAALAGLCLAMPVSAWAQVAPTSYAPVDQTQMRPGIAPETDLIIELGIGGRLSPAFEGSGDYELTPFPIIRPRYVNIPGLGSFGGRDGTGFSISPVFGYTGERKGKDYDEVIGLNDVDATFDAGLRAAYGWQFAEVYGEARYAFGGAHGLIGEVGANAILRPTPAWEIKVGPFTSFAGDDYMDTYFSVTPAESLNTGGRLAAYEADGGIKSAGVNASVRYEFRQDWFVNAEASYARMVSDAGDSPITQAGDRDQFTVGLGISRRFTLDLF